MREVTAWMAALSLAAGSARADLVSDAAALKAHGINPTGSAVLAYITKRTPTSEVPKKIDALLKQLEDDEQSVRDKAVEGLVELGALARGRLVEAAKSRDAEVRKRARQALEKIGPATDDAKILPAVARVLAAKKQAGALEALLVFLPHIEKPVVAEEVAAGLAPLAVDKNGKAEPAALKAMASKSEVVRHTAGRALAKAAGARAAVRKLLKDSSAGVRRRVALALLEARDKEAIPALVALTGVDSVDDAEAAEEALAGLAVEKAPELTTGDDAKSRARSKAAWEKWWKEAGPKFDLAKAELNGLGRGMGLLGVQEPGAGMTKIFGLDANGKRKFTLDAGRGVIHASMARRDRVLVTEMAAGRIGVVEMDLNGKTYWTKDVTQALCAYRLRNGQTFIACRNQLLILDRGGKEVRKIDRPGSDVSSAFLFDNGTISLLTLGSTFLRLDKDGRQISSVDLGKFVGIIGMKCHFAKDGSLVVPDYWGSKVRSYDKAGMVKWETRVDWPMTVTVLPGGNLLVTPRLKNQTVELDKDGKAIKTTAVPEGHPVFFERR